MVNRGQNLECITEALKDSCIHDMYICLSIEILKQLTRRSNKTFDNSIIKLPQKWPYI